MTYTFSTGSQSRMEVVCCQWRKKQQYQQQHQQGKLTLWQEGGPSKKKENNIRWAMTFLFDLQPEDAVHIWDWSYHKY